MDKILKKARAALSTFNSRKSGAAEKAAFLLYVVSAAVLSAFHEPWFDEAQAWLIARDATLYDIFFTIPHYEGHPPLWYLILYPLANLGAPYELSLKIISVSIAALAMALLIFKSPFPRIVRIILPFTYYFFYQYAVITRPYGLMILAFFLTALAYPKRRRQPGRFALCIAFLSSTCAYGLIFGASLGLVWLLETLYAMRGPLKERIKAFLKGRLFRRMLLLLAYLLALVAEILPRSDTYAIEKMSDDNSPVLMFIYNLFGLPVESAFGDSIGSYTLLNRYKFNPWIMAAEILIGLFMAAILLYYGYRKKRMLLLTVPAVIFSLFCAFVYIYMHHIGLVYVFLVFWFWVCLYTKKEKERVLDFDRGRMKRILKPAVRKAVKKISVYSLALSLAITFAFSVCSAINEVNLRYGYGRGVYEFITKYGLQKNKIMTSWESGDTNEISYAICYLPYFKRDIVYNVNVLRSHVSYDTHVYTTDEENEENYRAWRKAGKPDVVIGMVDFSELYPDQTVTESDYVLVAEIPYTFIWKASYFYGYVPIYVRKTIAEEKDIPILYDPQLYGSMDSIFGRTK